MPRRSPLGLLVALTLGLVANAAAQPSSNLNDYVLLATGVLKAKSPTITSGAVGVNDPNGVLFARRSFDAPNSVVASDRARFDKDPTATVVQQLFANVVDFGPTGTPFTPPIIADVLAACGFPDPFPVCSPGVDVDVAVGVTTVLAPGAYGKVRVHGTSLSAGSLVLTGGSYVFCDLKVSRTAQLRIQTPSTVNVAGKASFGPSSFFGPDTASGLVASDIQLYSPGSLMKFSRSSVSNAHVCAPNAKMRMSRGGSHVGVYVAQTIRTEAVTLSLGSPSAAFVE
jgi:hypothetical protein